MPDAVGGPGNAVTRSGVGGRESGGRGVAGISGVMAGVTVPVPAVVIPHGAPAHVAGPPGPVHPGGTPAGSPAPHPADTDAEIPASVVVGHPTPGLVGDPAPAGGGPAPPAVGVWGPADADGWLPGIASKVIDVDPAAVAVEDGFLAAVPCIHMEVGVPAAGLAAGLDPLGEGIVPGQNGLGPRHLARCDLGGRAGLEGRSTLGGRHLGLARPHLDTEAAVAQGLQPVEAGAREVHRGGGRIDAGRLGCQRRARDLQDHGAVSEKQHGAVAGVAAAEGYGIEGNRGVLVQPECRPIGELDLHPGLPGRVEPVTGDQGHVDHGFGAVRVGGRLDGGVTLHVGDVAQGGQVVLIRGQTRPGRRRQDDRYSKEPSHDPSPFAPEKSKPHARPRVHNRIRRIRQGLPRSFKHTSGPVRAAGEVGFPGCFRGLMPSCCHFLRSRAISTRSCCWRTLTRVPGA